MLQISQVDQKDKHMWSRTELNKARKIKWGLYLQGLLIMGRI